MLGWIVATIIFFCFVVVLSLYWFERKKGSELQRQLNEIKGTNEYKLKKRVADLERCITLFLKGKKQDTVFAATFEDIIE